jgi:signal transduction histidine kinase
VVNNAIKYAHCKQLLVEVTQRGSWLSLKIKDDGKGFAITQTKEGYQPTSVKGGGNGLQNMQQRAAGMNGALAIYSAPGQGTIVELRFPLT